ncbi:hypothetical protein SNE40_018243 [Patella caerulea]|uniref:SWIM-type domain-containing protein n=1 Tax=Patella caerulea TaxID=87958 RepID=A0AAN8J9A5_PATCE
MKKNVKYNVAVSVNLHGLIEECQCDCGAGMGPEAHCKHVNALLYAMCVFSDKGEVLTEETYTQKLQTFHQVRRHRGSPVKACDLKFGTKRKAKEELRRLINYDPRPFFYRKAASYIAHFRSVCLNAPNISRLPLSQMYAPANIQIFAGDHDYLKDTHEDLFLKEIGHVFIDSETITSIAKSTVMQSSDKKWLEMRCLRLNSSDFGRICKLTERTDKDKYAIDLTEQKDISSLEVILKDVF